MALGDVFFSSLDGAILPSLNTISATDNIFDNNGRTILMVTNAGSASTVTVESLVDCEQGFTHDLSVEVHNQTKLIGPFPMNRFNNSSGKVTFDATNSADSTALAISL